MVFASTSNKTCYIPNPHSQEIPIYSFEWGVGVIKTHFSFLQHQPIILKYYQPFKICYHSPSTKKTNLSNCETSTNSLRTAAGEKDSTAQQTPPWPRFILFLARPLTINVTFQLISRFLFLRDRGKISSTTDEYYFPYSSCSPACILCCHFCHTMFCHADEVIQLPMAPFWLI